MGKTKGKWTQQVGLVDFKLKGLAATEYYSRIGKQIRGFA
jgi:hypothetical protein